MEQEKFDPEAAHDETKKRLEAMFDGEPKEYVFGNVKIVRYGFQCGLPAAPGDSQVVIAAFEVFADFLPYRVTYSFGFLLGEGRTMEDAAALMKDRDEIAAQAMFAIQRAERNHSSGEE